MRDTLERLSDRNCSRSEATIQADIRQLPLIGGLGLAKEDLEVKLETQVGGRRWMSSPRALVTRRPPVQS
ncbi:hypothetical protein Misp02_28590 [Microtetraspora sp. NBRC 16547]|nr:hypothetical protein Misp02_28590 [Microtetraspora sp. NBRC 16547]